MSENNRDMEINVIKRDGKSQRFNPEKINHSAQRACQGLDDVSVSELVLDAKIKLFDGIKTVEIDGALIDAAREKIVYEPNYSYVAARLLLNNHYKDVFGRGVDSETFEDEYRLVFVKNIKKMVKHKILKETMQDFDLKRLAAAIQPERDMLFKYLGAKTLQERYFLKKGETIFETPQAFWMRVAMGVCLAEKIFVPEVKNVEDRIIELYDTYSTFSACPSTPTLFNSGTIKSQLSSCFLNTFEDSIHGIFQGLWQEALKSKHAGGLGFDVSRWRAAGAHIKGTNGESGGIVPWLKNYNDMLISCNQSGKRPGSGCAYLEPWHLDYMDFLELRRNTGEERRRTHDLNTASWIPDEFMRRVESDSDWYFFCPHENPKLHNTFGAEFVKEYEKAIKRAEKGEVRFKKDSAKNVWKAMLKSLFETSHPWITFKDASNARYTNQHEGVVNSSNLCTEITLHTKPNEFHDDGTLKKQGETAVCTLASANLKNHVKTDENGKRVVDWTKLAKTVSVMIRGLDNTIEINFYPTVETRSHLKHRPLGFGIMGYHDLCFELGIDIDSDESKDLSNKVQEYISYCAIRASSEVAKERGRYDTYQGSLWDKNVFPIDSYISHAQQKDGTIIDKESLYSGSVSKEQWSELREHVKAHGMRNSNVMAIAPTATISYIQGCNQSIEPSYTALYVYGNGSSGNLIIDTYEYLKRDLKDRGIFNVATINEILMNDGDTYKTNLPDDLKKRYCRVFDRDMKKLIEINEKRQIWIDQAISFNCYNKTSSIKSLSDMYVSAWKHNLKTTYYLRNLAANEVKKTAIVADAPKEVKEPKQCSLDNPTCESCQ